MARQVLYLVVILVLVSSQASAQYQLFKTSSSVQEDPPGTFSDETPLLDGSSLLDGASLLDGELRDEVLPGMEPKPLGTGTEGDGSVLNNSVSEGSVLEGSVLNGAVSDGTAPEVPEEEIVFDGSYWDVISSGEWLNAGRWYTQADLVMLNRSSVQRRELSALAFASGASVQNLALAMTTEVATFGYEPGTRLTVGKFLGRDKKNRDQSIEFSFFGMNEWSTGFSVTNSTTNLFYVSLVDGNAAGFKFAETHGFSYKSNFNSYELNARVRSRLGKDRMVLKPNGLWQRESNKGRMTSFIGGLRLISIDEEFSYFARGRTVFQTGTPDPHSGELLTKTTNDMFGFQLGAEIYEQTYNWSYGLRGKVGALVNFADQQSIYQFVDTVTPGTPFNVAANDEQLTLLLELSIAATYQLRPNMALRFSYDLLYLQGLAQAPEQMSFDAQDQARINTGSYTLFDGASFGFEVIW